MHTHMYLDILRHLGLGLQLHERFARLVGLLPGHGAGRPVMSVSGSGQGRGVSEQGTKYSIII